MLPAAATEICMDALREAALQGLSVGGTYSLPLPNGEHWFELSVAAMPATGGGERRFIVLARDITVRHRVETASRESEMRLRLVIRGGDIGFWDWALRSGGLVVNERWCDMLGLDSQRLTPGIEVWNSRVHPDDAPKLMRLLEEVMRDPSGDSGEVEVRARHQAGHWVWILDRFSVVSRDADGVPLRAVGTLVDITERKLAELALQASLRDKEALLKEVHHRVKNNLQVVSSLLRLESGRSGHAPTKLVLSEMQGRIRTMALLHESIYRSGTFASIDLGTYLGQVATQAFRSLQTSGAAVRLRLDLDSVQVGLDQATPCGLLLTELVSNALKHGFPAGADGEVCIELQAVPHGENGRWRLRVSDNGVGLPADFVASQQDSLGLQLVASLALQLGGSLDVGAARLAATATAAGGVAPRDERDDSARGASFAISFVVNPGDCIHGLN
jgi:PAS domain S-box-containing protein